MELDDILSIINCVSTKLLPTVVEDACASTSGPPSGHTAGAASVATLQLWTLKQATHSLLLAKAGKRRREKSTHTPPPADARIHQGG